jgi:hypothetical protein
MPIAADKLKTVLGIRRVEIAPAKAAAVQDQPLA